MDAISTILSDVTDMLSGAFALLDAGEEEIERAQKRHPEKANEIWHAFSILVPSDAMQSMAEFVFRSHCRELLERIVTGADTRPGTAAEVCATLCAASQVAPLTGTAAGLYHRMWAQAFPDMEQFSDQTEHYEALHGSHIDDLERETRRKLRQSDRQVKDKDCKGLHHGEPATDCPLYLKAQAKAEAAA
ncbi:MAG: hypothetical protein J2P17_31155 [Mycobacterium sp.]|nr:hypothetical protein [Mycobacterium sp.]